MIVDVKAERLKKNLTQQDLADKVGVRRSTISMIELGVNKPSVTLAKKIGEVLKLKKKVMTEWIFSLN